jgi:hypothetical protein
VVLCTVEIRVFLVFLTALLRLDWREQCIKANL